MTGLDMLAQIMTSINAGWISVAVSAAFLLTAVAYGADPSHLEWAAILLVILAGSMAVALILFKVFNYLQT